MPSAKLTKRVADGADLTRGRHCVWDTEVKGFGLQIEPTGTKTYIVRYRPKGLGRSASRRYYKIGRHGDLTSEQAREQAKYLLGLVAIGQDPAAAQHAQRQRAAEEARPASLAEVGAAFLEDHAAVRCKRSTVQLYELMLRRHISPQLGQHPVAAVTKGQVRALHHSLRDHVPTANRALQLISSLYSFAARKELVPEGFNPARGIQKYREVSRERYLSSAELQQLGAALIEAETVGIPWLIDMSNPKAKHTPKTWNDQRQQIDPHAVAAIRLLLFTGARLREILHLQWAHVDLERGLLLLPDSKTGKKTIVLNGAALDIVARLRGNSATSPSSFVIKGLIDGKPRADLKKPWQAIRRHARLEDVRLHDLRHTFASVGAGASLGLPIVGRLLGHSQPQTTARYAHLDADPLRRAADLIGDRLSAALSPAALGGPTSSPAGADSAVRREIPSE